MPLPKKLIGKINGDPEPLVQALPIANGESVVMDRAGVRCRVCSHPYRSEIERRYADLTQTGIAYWIKENGWPGVPATIIKKHFVECVVGELILSKGAQNTAERFVARVETLVGRIEGYLDEFDQQDDPGDGIKAPKDWKGLSTIVNQLRASLELLGKATGHLGPDNVVNIIEAPQFVAVATSIAQITVQCPNCGPAVKNVLMDGSQ